MKKFAEKVANSFICEVCCTTFERCWNIFGFSNAFTSQIVVKLTLVGAQI